MRRSPKEIQRCLYEIAKTQEGFFTTKQAKAAGYAEATHPYHVQAGDWIREHRGIYRLALFPLAERWDLMLYWLWSRDRNDVPQGIYSHQTALSLYDLSDINPAKLHMMVPKNFRRHSETPAILVLHRGEVLANEVAKRHGVPVTRPLRTIVDLLVADSVSEDILRQAIHEAWDRGLITNRELETVAPPARVRPIFDHLLQIEQTQAAAWTYHRLRQVPIPKFPLE